MKNKKGQIPPQIVPLLLIVIAILGIGWHNSNQNFNEKVLGLQKEINKLDSQLSKINSDLNSANKIIAEKNKEITNLKKDLDECNKSKNDYEKFNLFWLKEINVTKLTGFIINLSFAFSLFSLFKFTLFKKTRRKKQSD